MSDKKHKEIRKANKVHKKDMKNLVDKVIERQRLMPLNKRWRIALKILIGQNKDKWLLIGFFVMSQCLAISISISFLLYFW